jgi:hypothetical protein
MNGRTPSRAFIEGIGKENTAQAKQPKDAA